MRFIFSIAFLISLLMLPWWATTILAIILVSFWGRWTLFIVILGGLVMDIMYGAPIASLGGFSYLYSTLFLILAALAFALRHRMLE